jgi:hypothetical protein
MISLRESEVRAEFEIVLKWSKSEHFDGFIPEADCTLNSYGIQFLSR